MGNTEPAQMEDRIVFSLGPRGYSVREIVDSAFFRGDVQPHWHELLLGLEAQKKAEESDTVPDDATLESAAIAFRYQYDLITAEETERWLELRGLTLADFSEYFARQYWQNNSSDRVDSADVAYPAAPRETRELLATDLVLSGELDRMATRLAWRVASGQAADDSEPDVQKHVPPEGHASACPLEAIGVERERAQLLDIAAISAADLPECLAAFGRDDAWLNEIAALEAAFRTQCATILTEEARARELTALRLPLTRFDVEMIELESHDAAKEAFLCVRDDGMSMEEVAQEGRYPFHRTEMVLEAIAPDLQQKFLSLTAGSLLEPTPREDGFLLTRILAKKEPTLLDAEVRERVGARILERHFSDLAAGRIQWSIVPTANPAE